MSTKQQKETLDYFKKHADVWQTQASSQDQRKVNVIQQRNGYVLQVIKERTTTRSFLDVGCGTGELVCEVARQGIDATGIDFAEEMIKQAQIKAREAALERATFLCCSIFDFDLSNKQYDTISANGFIEYISLEQMDRFFDLAFHALHPDGSLVLSSRNRLFNLFSLNNFTLDEIESGVVPQLLKEAIALAEETSFDKLISLSPAPLQAADSQHTHTGIDVATRFQYTPLQLIHRLTAKGFSIRQVYPIHIHAAGTVFREHYPELHSRLAYHLQDYAGKHMALLPFASSFMLHVIK